MRQSVSVDDEDVGPPEALLADYHRTLLSMHACRVERGGDPKRWNRLVNQLQSVQLRLRTSPEGRSGISSLINAENATVRQWSAGFALAWDPLPARAELERLAADEASLAGFEAKITLREFDAGRLDMTWRPKGKK